VVLTDLTTHTGWTSRAYEQILYSSIVPPTKQFMMSYRNNQHDFFIAQGYIPSPIKYDFSTGKIIGLFVHSIVGMTALDTERNLTLDQCAVTSANGTWYILASSNLNDTTATNFTLWANSNQTSQSKPTFVTLNDHK
jgi:hypothetical protein